ncbi:PREDICTED: putative vomeronasal receptor-like protein 4 [Condylura cristata]|uniref:putative vomeronasal receptor-like protein 4 n=1 Tax=Condylura cristata TaxID=143302 RepID=UPI00033445E1|nr:PREDICTED: putative vomeronasal receptor-like protein 4 [Condylura cristata]
MLPFENASCFQAGIGISANIFLLLFRIFTSLLDHKRRPADMITCHLAFVHIMMLFTLLFLMSPDLFESLNLQNDLKCKTFIYLSRVTRGLSICTTCLLSLFQAITISPSTSQLSRLKRKFTNSMVRIFFIFWSLSLSFSSNLIFYIVAVSNETQSSLLNFSKYCSLSPTSTIMTLVFFTLTMSRDVSFGGVMLLSSAYMVTLLIRHQRQAQHLHSTSLFPRLSPEKKATQTILLLVSFFVIMYWVDLILSSYSTLLWEYGPVILGVQSLVTNVYPTVSPLVLISSDKRIKNIFQQRL